MSKIKYIIIVIFMSLILFLIPNSTNAAVDVSKNVYSNNGSMKFTFTGLDLDITHEYEYGFTVTAATEVEDWFLITECTENSAVIDLITTTKKIREVMNVSDTGYITIKDKTTNNIILEAYAVDLKIPYLKVTNYTVIENGKEFGSGENESINVGFRNAINSEAYYQYEKITDQEVINKYKEIKEQNGDVEELANILRQEVPTNNWNSWDYWNGHDVFTHLNGFGYPEGEISVPDEGLYYMWLYFSGKNVKNVYGYILVDNLSTEVSNNNQQNNNTTASGQQNTSIVRNDYTAATIKLPAAGMPIVIIVILVIAIICTIIFYIKHKIYKNIK